MSGAIDDLTEKEKETLRLIVRGHDAKSAASALDLSVHTINERLRAARRKLDVTSSREAARVLLESEARDERDDAGATPEKPVYEALGDAEHGESGASVGAATHIGWWVKHRFALIATGVCAMSLMLAALLLPASPLPVDTVTISGPETAHESQDQAAARAAESFLELIDQSRWADSYAATGAQFRQANTLEVWTKVSQKVREPLGKNLTRNLIVNEYVPAPPNGVQVVKFASSYADGTNQVETVSLAWEDDAWKVVGIVIG